MIFGYSCQHFICLTADSRDNRTRDNPGQLVVNRNKFKNLDASTHKKMREKC